MYGTVARMQAKPGAEQQLLQQLRDFEEAKVPGFVMTQRLVYRSARRSTT